MTSKKNITALQLGYYRLSGENRTLITAQARELAAIQKQAPPEPEGGEGKAEKADSGRGMAAGDKPGGVE
jgi:hypothetical protein